MFAKFAPSSISPVIVTLCGIVVCATAHAETFEIVASDSGFVTEAGGSSKGDGTLASGATFNYSVGRELHYVDGAFGPGLVPMNRKNYFLFDLTSVTHEITSATLVLYAGPDDVDDFPSGMHGYESLDASETYAIHETTDPMGATMLMGDLLSATSPDAFDETTDPLIGAAKDLYLKLGDGPLLMASTVVTAADDDTFLSIDMTGEGLGYMNSFLGALLVLGGSLTTAAPPDSPQSVFGHTGPDVLGAGPYTPKLIVTTVPEPSSFMLLVVAGLLLSGYGYRYRKYRGFCRLP